MRIVHENLNQASIDILGIIGSGVSLENKVSALYKASQKCLLAYLHIQPPFLIGSLYKLPHSRRLGIRMLP
jgi:hypothetical protein